ncbi:DUF6215 domain-containing protein [Streptomyces sp. NPDC055897]
MTEDIGAPVDKGNPWRQGIAAVVAVAALCGGAWWLGETSGTSPAKPARCSGGKPDKTAAPAEKAHTSGAQLCEALNRPDLAELLGTPDQKPRTASGSQKSMRLLGSEDIVSPSARVEFDAYTVELSATYDRLTVAESAVVLGKGAQQQAVLGHPAFFYSDRTVTFSIGTDGRGTDSGPGSPVRALTVALGDKDSGGSYEVTLWRADGVLPDDAVVRRVAEKVLPTVPGWTTGGVGVTQG